MLRSAILSLVCVLNFFFTHAQDYRSGFILKPTGDSVKGYIKYGSRKFKSRVCYFKPNKQAKKIVYRPNDIRGYGFNDDRSYESKNASKRENEFRFMEILVKGRISLYRYLSLFYLEKDSLFVLSKEPQTTSIVDGVERNSTTLKYVGILNLALSDCSLKVGNVPYHEREMIKLIQNYNFCKGGSKSASVIKKPWLKIGGTVFSGLDQSSVSLDGFSGYSFKQSVSIPVGLGIDLNNPRWSDKNHFNVEMWYDKKLYQSYSESTTNGTTNRTDVVINTSYLKIPLGLRFNLLQEENTPYLKVGFVQYLLLNISGTIISEIENNGIVSTSRSETLSDKKNTNGFWIGGGYMKKLYSHYVGFVEFRYEKNNGFTSSGPGSNSSGNALNLLFGFKF